MRPSLFGREIICSGKWSEEEEEREGDGWGRGLRREEVKDGATGAENAVLLLHAPAVVAQDFTFLAQVLRVLLALVGDVQAVRLLQRSLRKETERSGQPAKRTRKGSNLAARDRYRWPSSAVRDGTLGCLF